jgi:two-component system, NtrC family, response regulator AtoC
MKANVLIVDDDENLRRALGDRFRYWGHAVTLAGDGAEALAVVERRSFDLILLDLAMPGVDGLTALGRLRAAGCEADIVVLTAHGSVEKAVEAMKAGANDFLSKPADFELLRRTVERAFEKRRLQRVSEALAEQAAVAGAMIVGPSPAMQALLETASRAARSDATVLLCGESGTGKQVLAEHIHAQSPRSAQAFVYVNCVAISDELIESTLFGHEKGAFTGAVGRKPGRLEAAADGTAFLDEVGDVSSRLQTKLLHFLESGEFERVGGSRTISVDCRIIAATNRDLEQGVRDGRFREDLFYRLNVIRLLIPPLRERREDIPMLAETFLRRCVADLKRGEMRMDAAALQVMQAYDWPGNVRQLRNAIERMAVLASGETLTPDLLPPEIAGGAAAAPIGSGAAGARSGEPTGADATYREALAHFKRDLIMRALARAGGNQTKAAEALGLQRTYLNRLIKELETGATEPGEED